MCEARDILADLEDLRQERRRDNDRDRAAVVQDVREVAGREERVRRDRDRADLDRSKERVDKGRRVEAKDHDALLEPDPELAEGVAAAVDVGSELAVGSALTLATDRDS